MLMIDSRGAHVTSLAGPVCRGSLTHWLTGWLAGCDQCHCVQAGKYKQVQSRNEGNTSHHKGPAARAPAAAPRRKATELTASD